MDYYNYMYGANLNNVEEMINFLELYILQKLNQEQYKH